MKLLAGKKNLPHLHYSDHVESAPGFLEKACGIGVEGIVSKQKNSFYRGKRTHDWVKSKCGLEQEFVIGGFMPAKEHPRAVGSLLLGYYKGKKLLYAGKVGTGFSQREAEKIYRRLSPLKAEQSPFDGPVERGSRRYVWTQPSALCEVSFWEWTADKHIRHAVFKGLREDKPPKQVREEVPEQPPSNPKKAKADKKVFTVEGIVISHPDREVYPGTGITKGDVAAYYAKIMPFLLPYAKNRLISLLRCTDTIEGELFFQRAPMKGGKGACHGSECRS